MSLTWPKRVTVFSTDIPYPPNRGGRADVWRRIQAMSRTGVSVQLVAFFDDLDDRRPTLDHLSAIGAVVSDLHAFPIRRGTAARSLRLLRLGQAPWHAVSRTLPSNDLQRLLSNISAFRPDLIWTEGPWCGLVSTAAAQATRAPMAYRSHNIEHVYMARQAAVAKRLRDKLAWRLACVGLKRFEQKMLSAADWVFDISLDDMAFWQTQGVQHISWLPPVAESALAPPRNAATGAGSPLNDVVFLGNLTTPNNVRGVEWLVNEVRPLVLAQRPETGFVVAGSNPGPYIRELCARDGVRLLANVADALALYASARVLVNPVRSGSGMHIKAIEMLMMDAPIVTATQGTSGMPPEVKRLFRVADTAEQFAAHIVDALVAPLDLGAERVLARSLFGVEGVATALGQLGKTLAARQAPAPA
jgi:hypothetical protein